MINFIISNWYSILAVIIFVGGCIFLYQRGCKTQINKMLLFLVTEAEKKFGDGTGELKFSAVSTWLYEKLPPISKVFLTSKQIDAAIEDAVTRMKEYFEKNSKAANTIFSE